MKESFRRAGAAARLLRLAGSNPALLRAEIGHRYRRSRQIEALRTSFDVMISQVPLGAWVELEPVDLPRLGQLPDELQLPGRSLLLEARQVLDHEMQFLGPRVASYGDDIDWLSDPATGHRWPTGLHFDIPVVDLTSPDDPKRVWELSRGHQLLTLARASRLDPDGGNLFRQELEMQWNSWIETNPVGMTINWTNAMEAGIRTANWVAALKIVGVDSLSEATVSQVTISLQQHGRYIEHHLEGSPRMRSNHFVADLLGLAVLGTALRGDPAASTWCSAAERWLPREILAQVHPDGGDFEASLPYHGLVMEMFCLANAALSGRGWSLTSVAKERLVRMVDLSRSVRHGNGRTPQFGDSDSGRVLPEGFERIPSQDAVIWMAAATLGLGRPLPGPPHPEVAWTLGLNAWGRIAEAELMEKPVRVFSESGIYVLDAGGGHAVVDCGDVGQAGNGGHAHNDALAFEWSLDGEPVVIDPGTFTYTGDVETRNAMRSTAAHATPQIDGQEINPIDPDRLFQLDEVSAPWVATFEESEEAIELVAGHGSFLRLNEPVKVVRTVRLNRSDGSLHITDQFEGRGRHAIRQPLTLGPGWTARIDRHRCLLEGPGPTIAIEFSSGCDIAIEKCWCSPAYGHRQKVVCVVITARREMPTETTMWFSRVREAGT